MSSPNKSQLVITDEARADLLAIAYYTAMQWGEEQALAYQNSLYQTITHIGDNPEIGHPCYGIPSVIKGRISGKHVVFYRTTRETTYIMRVLHESMDHGRHLQQHEKESRD